jgi:dTMP kinase
VADARGRFITVEGVEGAGKSTHLATIRSWIEQRAIDLVVTREPGGTELGERVRALLLDPAYQGMTDLAELLLVFAARAEHIARIIEPALAAGRWVLSDRFTDASYAYQGGGREMGPGPVATLETLVQGTLRPDLTLLLDVPPATGLARIGHRGPADRFERESLAFFERVRAAYLARAATAPARYRVVDTDQPLETVAADIEQALEDTL